MSLPAVNNFSLHIKLGHPHNWRENKKVSLSALETKQIIVKFLFLKVRGILREDAHKKVFFFSGRTTKVWVPPSLYLCGFFCLVVSGTKPHLVIRPLKKHFFCVRSVLEFPLSPRGRGLQELRRFLDTLYPPQIP